MTTRGVTRAYLRISLATERSGSIEKQRQRITAAERAAGRNPSKIVWYTDEGVSGSKAIARPGRDKLVADMGAGDRLVALKVDRLARSVRDLLNIAERVESVGATLNLVDDSINTDGPMGRFMLTLLGAVAELEAANIGERVRASRQSFVNAGRHAAGKVPFGFEAVPNPDGPGLVVRVDPDEGPRLRQAVLRVLAGESQNVVRESIGMSKTGFHKMLNNPRLYGATPVDGGVLMIDGTPRINPDAAILSLAEWRALQEHLGKADKAWSRQDGFGRVILCGVCGDRTYRNASKRKPDYATYRCRKVNHGPGDPGVSVMVKPADELVASEFLGMFGAEPYRVASVRDDDSARTEAVSLANVRISELERKMRSVGRDERAALSQALMEAYDALEEAQGLPAERRQVVTDTGRTIADVWAEVDDSAREGIVSASGSFVIGQASPGSGIADRLTWEGHTPESVRVNGQPVAVGLADLSGRLAIEFTPSPVGVVGAS